MSGKNYWRLQKFSIFYSHYAFIDSPDYLADQLFIKQKVKVDFDKEYGQEGSNYLVIFCKVRKTKEKEFIRALEELENKMLLMGHKDYLNFCTDMKKKSVTHKSMKQRLFLEEYCESCGGQRNIITANAALSHWINIKRRLCTVRRRILFIIWTHLRRN